MMQRPNERPNLINFLAGNVNLVVYPNAGHHLFRAAFLNLKLIGVRPEPFLLNDALYEPSEFLQMGWA